MRRGIGSLLLFLTYPILENIGRLEEVGEYYSISKSNLPGPLRTEKRSAMSEVIHVINSYKEVPLYSSSDASLHVEGDADADTPRTCTPHSEPFHPTITR